MIALISLFVIIIISIIVVRIGATALELTGIPQDIAAFQAQSAFSGTGFTTSESEYIVNNPLRRRIIRILIMLGSAGLTTSIATLIIAFVGKSAMVVTTHGMILMAGLLMVFLFARSKLIYRLMRRIIVRILRSNTSIDIYDFQEILGLSRGYSIARFKVKENSWLINKNLKSLDIRKEGILILNIIRRSGKKELSIGAPTADTVIHPGDELICYGLPEQLKLLSERLKGRKGNEEHKMLADMQKNTAKNEEFTLESADTSNEELRRDKKEKKSS